MKPIAWLIIIGSMVVLQYHSINFWLDMTNSWIGWVVSPIIEIASLMFWYKSEKLLAGALSFVVVSASLFHLSKGSIETLVTIDNNNVSQKTLNIIEKTLQKADANNHWVTRQKSLDAITTLAKNKAEVKTTKPVAIMNIIVEIVMIVMIFIAQIKSVLILLALELETKTETDSKQSVTNDTKHDTSASISVLAKETIKQLREFGMNNGFNSETSIRNALDLSAPTFGRLVETYKTGKGMTEKKMLEIQASIKNYKS